MAHAEFSAHHDDHDAVLVVRGEVDLSCADELRRKLRRVIETAERRRVVVDLALVTFLDSTGLEALLQAQGIVGPHAVTLRGLSAPVRRVLEVTGTLDRFLVE